MADLFASETSAVILTFFGYFLAQKLYHRFRFVLFNPVLVPWRFSSACSS